MRPCLPGTPRARSPWSRSPVVRHNRSAAPASTPWPDQPPGGRFLLVESIERPFSRLVPYDDFPKHARILDLSGVEVYSLAKLPLADAVPINGVPTGPRRYAWDPTQPARVTWVVALDEGDPKKTVPNRDRLMALELPTRMAPVTWHRTKDRCQNISWTEDGQALVTEYDSAHAPHTVSRSSDVTARARVLFERSSEDALREPGQPVPRARPRYRADPPGRHLPARPGAPRQREIGPLPIGWTCRRARPPACSAAAASSSSRSWRWFRQTAAAC